MTDAQQREAARQFYYRWNGKGKEDEDARSYWIEILQDILGVDNVTKRIDFEKKVISADGNTKRIDVYIPETHVLIEQKSLGIPLDKPQAGHGGKTPYEQAKEYDNGLPFDEKSRWIILSNFAEIWIYDMNQKKPEPVKLLLSDLQSKYHLLNFLVNSETQRLVKETQVSLQAGELVGMIYDAFQKQYKNPDDPETLKSLNKLCVRIVFCLYGEDAGIFGKKNMFHDYMAQFDAAHARKGLRDLFKVLNQKTEERDSYLADDDPLLAAFPYVNGGLFADNDNEIPPFTDKIMNLLLTKASDDFDWSGISPTIFGAVFESTLNPETRRSGGMHYTSLENIHKVIDPLFLDDLKEELEGIKRISIAKDKIKKLEAFQNKLASLTWLDPAAGSGNFLTETYISIRKLENEVIRMRLDLRKGATEGQEVWGFETINPIKVSIGQFYGIEINDFATAVAQTALWIAENQMMKETENIVHMSLDFLPLKTSARIVEGNALRLDWNDVVKKEDLNYIISNPPFRGMKFQSAEQKHDMAIVFKDFKNYGSLDYVASWYVKAAKFITSTGIKTAFVSTNSITQGEQAAILWKPLCEEYGVHIAFAHRTFQWDSEASVKAHVHCIIIGFSLIDTHPKRLFDSSGTSTEVSEINCYLCAAPNVFISNRTKPLCSAPKVVAGNKPVDGDFLKIDKDDYDDFIEKEPRAKAYIKKLVGGFEFINNVDRYVLWLVGVSPEIIKSMPLVYDRVKKVRTARLSMKDVGAIKLAETPTTFRDTLNPQHYIVIPIVSSENRRYVPMGFLDENTIPTNQVQIVPDATIYDFGVLESNVHMAWMRTVCGRLKSDYRYTAKIVYNNFPWPEPTAEQKTRIEETAQGILDARELYPDASLADLYDPLTMPPELLKAHQANDRAVMQAYGMPIKETDEAACVAWLMQLYQEKVAQLENKDR